MTSGVGKSGFGVPEWVGKQWDGGRMGVGVNSGPPFVGLALCLNNVMMMVWDQEGECGASLDGYMTVLGVRQQL